MECQTGMDPGKPLSSVFLKDQEEHSTQADCFGFGGLFRFLFELPQQNFCKINSLFSLLFPHEYLSVGSDLA
jgi:hypothetical protein